MNTTGYSAGDDNSQAMVWEPECNAMAGRLWRNLHESFVRRSEARRADIRVVFIGASIVQYWCEEGCRVWDQYYHRNGAVNYGICGDTIQNVLWRVRHRVLDGLQPRVVVLQCGANNMEPFGRPTDEDIGRGVGQLIGEIRAKLPDAKIISVGLMPLSDPQFTAKARRVNACIAPFADGKDVHFLDLIPHMTDSDGQQRGELFTDGLHLSAEGYAVWHRYMWPVMEKLL
ncbi:unnamed protein product [Medioppia subpectinata]|uniref:SGNH hydrolase-type esterase domain-containing protein n=1 Tax=Medioppia subpectinata TaxID=1979941 RepID=A0A7R9L6T3_9ACAR|nr:unnamed protein product [Medioppia subpectinata]CAG2116485.1 unnamed protein product [Medioppia subpectinata]